MSTPAPTTVEQLLTKLRAMLGHLTRRDRATVTEAIEAIFELSRRLDDATRTGVVDEIAPVTADQIEHIVHRRRATRAELLAMAGEADAQVEGQRALGIVDLPAVCGQRCTTHDECEYPCRRLVLHPGACDCRHGMTADEIRERLARASEGPPGPGSLDA